MLKLDNNTISFEDTIIFVASDNKKAKISFENVKNTSFSTYSQYDVIDTKVLNGDIKINLYDNIRLPSQYVNLIVIDGILFDKASNEYKEHVKQNRKEDLDSKYYKLE